MFPVSDVIPSRTVPFVTVGLIAVNVLVFFYEVSLGSAELRVFMATYAVVPAWFWWPSLVTSQFLHGGWMHIIWNMVYLWIFGDNVEDRLGHLGYVVFYFVCGLAADAPPPSSSVRRSTDNCVLQAGQGNVTSFIGSFVSSIESGFWQEVQTILIILLSVGSLIVVR